VIFHLRLRFVLVVHLLAVAPVYAATVNPSNEDADAHGNVPTLSSLIQRAITTHPLVEEGKANLRAGDQAVKTAKWQYFPTPGVSYEKAFVDGDGYTTVLSLDQPLWSGGRLSAGLDSAHANVSVLTASLAESRRELAFRVVGVYGQWLSASLQRQALEASESLHQELLERVQRRFDGGVSTGSDLELAIGRLQSVKALAAATAASEISAVTTLAVLTGQELDTATLAAGPRQSPPELDRWDQGLLIGALAHSPSLKRADANVKVARAGVKERRSATRPEVYLQFQREFDDHRPDSRVQVGIRSQFGAGLSSFSGIAQAREAVSSALALRRSEELAIREQVRSDLATLDSYALRRPALEEALRTSEQVYASYERQFLTGSKSWLDVMNSARDLQSAQLQVAEVIAGELSVEWRLYVLSNPLPVDGEA
jgi:adhesin transport system outer membrane protein